MPDYAVTKIRTQNKDGDKLRFFPGDEVKGVAPFLLTGLKETGAVIGKSGGGGGGTTATKTETGS